MFQPEALTRLVDELQHLPGIGRKSAQRLAFHILRGPREDADRLCDAVRNEGQGGALLICNNITDVVRASAAPTTPRPHHLRRQRRTSRRSRRRASSAGPITC
jgi:recombination protein RecR